MADEKEIKIKITGDTSGLQQATDQSSKQIEETYRNAGEQIKSSISSSLLGVALTIGTVGRIINENFTIYLQQGLNELQQIDRYSGVIEKLGFKISVSDVEKYIAELQKLTNISDSTLRPAFERALIITKDLDKTFEIIKLSADIAATGLVDMDTTARALSQVSIGLDYGLRMIIRQLGLAVPEGAKADQIFKMLHQTFDGLSENIKSGITGSFIEAQLKSSDLRETIGKFIAESESKYVPGIVNITTELENMVNKLTESKSPFADLLKDMVGFIGISTDVAKGFGNIANEVMNLIQTLALVKMAGIGGATAGAIGGATAGAIGGALGTVGAIAGIAALGVGLVKLGQAFFRWYETIPWVRENIWRINVPEKVEQTAVERGKAMEYYYPIMSSEKQVTNALIERGKAMEELYGKQEKVNDALSIEVENSLKLVGLRGEERDRMSIILEYDEKIAKAKEEGRLKDAEALEKIKADQLAIYDESVAKRKEAENKALEERARTIKDEVTMSKMSDEERVRFKIQREVESNMDLVKSGKLSYNELYEYAKLKFQETKEKETSWAKAELLGPTSAFLKELTGYSFTNAVKRIQVDVNLNGVNFTGNLTEAQARAIGAEIGLQLKSSGAIS